jgi:hypothetical protein
MGLLGGSLRRIFKRQCRLNPNKKRGSTCKKSLQVQPRSVLLPKQLVGRYLFAFHSFSVDSENLYAVLVLRQFHPIAFGDDSFYFLNQMLVHLCNTNPRNLNFFFFHPAQADRCPVMCPKFDFVPNSVELPASGHVSTGFKPDQRSFVPSAFDIHVFLPHAYFSSTRDSQHRQRQWTFGGTLSME